MGLGLGFNPLSSVVVNPGLLLQSTYCPGTQGPWTGLCTRPLSDCALSSEPKWHQSLAGVGTFLSSFPSLRRQTRLDNVNRTQGKETWILLGLDHIPIAFLIIHCPICTMALNNSVPGAVS